MNGFLRFLVRNRALMMSRNMGHQRLWVDACKAALAVKEHLGLTSSFGFMPGPMTRTVLMGNLASVAYMLQKRKREGKMGVLCLVRNYFGTVRTCALHLEKQTKFGNKKLNRSGLL